MPKGMTARACTVLALAVWGAVAASAEPVERIEQNGPVDNRIDVVVLGDGYAAADERLFEIDSETFHDVFVATSPFTEYRKYFNVKRIFTPSVDSGASKPEAAKDTALGAYYNCNGIRRLVCVDARKVEDVLARSVAVDGRDIVVVLVNDPEYGGSGGGGGYTVASASQSGPFFSDVVMHEIGHAFGGLGDEYPDDGNCGVYLGPYVNADDSINPGRISSAKWARWIPPNAAFPTPDGATYVGAFLGGNHCDTGWYRPTTSSKMRNNPEPYREVNAEELIDQIYWRVTPVDGRVPDARDVDVHTGTTTRFAAKVIDRTLPGMTYTWRLDGVVVGTGRTIDLDGTDFPVGDSRLEVIVEDRSPLSRLAFLGGVVAVPFWTVHRGR